MRGQYCISAVASQEFSLGSQTCSEPGLNRDEELSPSHVLMEAWILFRAQRYNCRNLINIANPFKAEILAKLAALLCKRVGRLSGPHRDLSQHNKCFLARMVARTTEEIDMAHSPLLG